METVTEINKLLFIMVCCLSVGNSMKASKEVEIEISRRDQLSVLEDCDNQEALQLIQDEFIRVIKESITTDALLLIQSGVNPNVMDEDGCPALILASKGGQQEVVSGLLKSSYNRQVTVDERRHRFAIEDFFEERNIREDRELLRNIFDSCSHINALEEGVREAVDVNATDSLGRTALSYAAQQGNSSIAQQLLFAQAIIRRCDLKMEGLTDDVRGVLQAEVDRRTPQLVSQLHYFTMSALSKKVEEQLEEVDVDASDEDGVTPLMKLSSCRGNREEDVKATLEILLRAGGDLEAVDKRGWTPLIWAAHHGMCWVVPGLLKAGAIVNATDKGRLTALDHAAAQGKTSVVRQLISAKALISQFIMDQLSSIFLGNSQVTEVLQAEVARKALLERRGLPREIAELITHYLVEKK